MKKLILLFSMQSTSRRFATALQILLVLTIASTVAAAQGSTDGMTPAGLTPGSPAGSYQLSDFDTVNLFNGSLNFKLPLLKVGGRGGAGYPITLHVEKKWTVYRQFEPGIGYFHYADGGWWSEGGEGWRVFEAGKVKVRAAHREEPAGVPIETLTRITFSAPDGTEYELRDQLTNGQPKIPVSGGFNRGTVFVTADGSAATFISDSDIKDDPNFGQGYYDDTPTGYMMLRDGTRFHVVDGNIKWMRDRNGNKVSFAHDVYGRLSTVTDSLNRQITFAYPSGTIGFTQITFKGFGGAQRIIKIGQTTLSNALRSGYAMQTITQLFPELHGGGVVDSTVVNYIELPDGRRFDLQYNPYAELARVVLPTGGAIEFDYAAGLTNGAASGVFSVSDPHPSKYIYRRVVERRVYPDGATGSAYESKMTYSRPETTTTNLGYVTTEQRNVSGILLSKSLHYFHGSARTSFSQKATHYSAWADGREYQTELFDTNGSTILKTTAHTFAQRAPVSWWTGDADLAPPNDPRLTESVSTLIDANLVSKQTFGYDDTVPYNNQNSVKEYHFGTGTAGALARETKTTFVTSATYTGTDVHLRNLPSEVSIYEGTTERARTAFEYDVYTAAANHALLVDRPGISGFDGAFTTSYTPRGNVTAATHYLLTNGAVTGSISNYSQFDIAGNVIKAIDGRGYATDLYFEDCFGTPDGNARLNSAPLELSSINQFSYALATRIVNSLNHSIYAQFDYYLGKPIDGEDANGVVASGYYNDSLDRPTQMVHAVGTSLANQITFVYDDTNRIVTSTRDFDSLNDPTPVKTQTIYDGMGRTTETRQYEGGTNYIAVQTQYDALGRAFKTSNPFRPWQSETAVWSTSAFDALGRVLSVTTPDSAVVATTYSGNTVTVTDQAGKKRKSVTDALGRLLEVYEDPTGLNYFTSYTYDVLDNLITVTQGTQTRTFTYDSLKRLKSATNPESGTINYSYDNNGNLLTKTDARSITTTYDYDSLNRNTTVNYSDTAVNPDITRTYDGATNGVGRLWASYAGGTETAGTTVEHTKIHSYDALGRPLDQRQRFKTNSAWSGEYQTQRTYNHAGSVLTQTYPSGRIVTYAYDGAGRSSSFTGNLGDSQNRTYATDITYSPFGGKTREQFGTNTPAYNKAHYNVRGQLFDVRVSNLGDEWSGELGALVNHYSTVWIHGGSGPDNNGNVLMSQTIINSNYMEDRYSYDALNRLTSVAEWQNGATNTGVQTYDYDRWGNRTINAAQTWGVGINNKQFTVDTANNRLGVPSGQSGTMSYDAAGNLTVDTYSGSAVTRAYDAENRMTSETQAGSVVAGSYSYNADGQRVRRKVNEIETWQVYGMDGELLAEYVASDTAASPQKEYGYRNGELLITAEAGTPGGGDGAQNVTWQNAVGVSVSGNSITKTAANAWGNAGAASQQTIISGDGYVEFSAGTTGDSVVGLGNGDPDQSYYIDFAIHVDNGNASIWEDGVWKTNVGAYASSDRFRVAVEGGVVKYRKGGTLLYTSAASPTYPLLVDSSLYANGSTVTNVVIFGAASNQNVGWNNTVGVSVSGNSITKTAANAWGNAGAASQQTIISGDGHVEFSAGTTGDSVVGLSNGDPDQSYNIDFAVHVDNGNASIWEDGVWKANVGTYINTDRIRVAIESGVVKYRKNGALLYTSTVTATYPLLFDSSLYANGSPVTNAVIYGNLNGHIGGSSAQINWLVTDQLGTPRIIADETGSLAGIKRHDYLPFGEELLAGTGGRTLTNGYSGDNVRHKFTSKERDNETGLDYSGARYYASTQGRFTSPDDFLNDTHVADPASWNLYVYVRNNPLNLIDPTGEKVNGAGLSDAERQQLIDDWQKKTGYARVYFDKNNTLTIDRSAGINKDANGKYLGSSEARAQLTDAVEATNKIFNLESANGSAQVGFADTQLTLTSTNAQTNETTRTYQVRIDFRDFTNVSGDRAAIDAFSIGIAAIHEFNHNLYGAITDSPNGPNNPGPVENNYINPIREQLGLAQRATYSAVPVGGALKDAYRGYVQVRFTLNGKDKMLRWRDTVVGGKHR